MDKSWMKVKNRLDPAYEKGVKEFLDFAFTHKEPHSKFPCPCIKCNNYYDQTREVVEDHLFIRGIVKSYTRWIHHGEDFEHDLGDDFEVENCNEDGEDDNMHELIHDIASGNFGHGWGIEKNLIDKVLTGIKGKRIRL